MESTQSNALLVPAAIVVAGGLIAGAIYFGGGHGSSTTVASAGTAANPAAINIAPVSAKDHILGSASAPVVIIEYSDTECPFCKVFHNTLHQVVDAYGGKVSWVYRQFPIAQLHSKAPHEAEATECVNELGGNLAFWTYLDKIFATTNSNNSLDPAQLPKLAEAQGIDLTAFNTCLNSGKYADTITKSIEEGTRAGTRGTPYSVIIKGNQKVAINGAEPIEMVKSKIDALLK